MPKIFVHLEPALCEPTILAGATAVVIDVLRATTTMIYALAAGAAEIRPCVTVDEARRLAEGYPPGAALLGGERQGLRIDGFQLGNSPSEYGGEIVRGKSIVFTTTNGTRALEHARQADNVLVAGFVNAAAAIRRLIAAPGEVHLVCAGTDRQVTGEDTLLAGFLVRGLFQEALQSARAPEFGNDSARLAAAACAGLTDQADVVGWLSRELAQSLGGRNLLALGLEADLVAAAQLNRFDLVPRYEPVSGTVRL